MSLSDLLQPQYTSAAAMDSFVSSFFNSITNDLHAESEASYFDFSSTSAPATIAPHLLHQQDLYHQLEQLLPCPFTSTETTFVPAAAVKTESSVNTEFAMLTPSSSEESFFTRHLSPSTSEGSLSSYDDDEDYEEEDDVLRAAPSIRVIENKPRRGGRRKKDIRPREEQLLPPASPRTMNDEELMGAYKQERNRLAAKRSRERKKGYVQELEETCQALKSHNDELSRELLRIKRDIKKMKAL